MTGARLLLLYLAIGASAVRCDPVSWSYHADFRHGFNGWMSYPLPQDLGFDPTLCVENSELLREVISVGQKRLFLGIARPIHFIARPTSRIRLRYRTQWSVPSAHLRLVLSAENGQQYQATLPAVAGPHEISINGTQLGLTAQDTPIKAVSLEAVIDTPAQGIPNRIVLSAFDLASFHTREAPNDAVVVIAKAAPHPRTLLTAKRIQQLKTAPEFSALRQQIHSQARTQAAQIKTNPSAGENIQRLPAGRSLRAEYDGELTAYFQLLDSYANSIASCALDYALNDDRTSLDSAKRNLLAVAQWPTWTPPRFASHGMHTYYEVGLFAQKLAFAYDLVAAEIPQTDKDRMALAFWKNAIQPTVEEYCTFDRMPLAASNWMANSLGGALMAAAVTEGDIVNWREREGPAVQQLTTAYIRNLRALFPGDGSELEPIGYQHFAMEGFSWGATALASLGIHPRELDRMFSSFWWPKYAMVRPDLILDGGDFDGELKSFDGFAWSVQNSTLPDLRAFYAQRPKREPSLLDLVCCTHDALPTTETPPLSRIFADRGSAIMRSGWDPASTVISLRAGPWFNHEHHDQGSFQVAAFGDRIISEAGYANYYRDPNYPTYFTQASGHNTVLLDDDPFSQPDSNRPSQIASHLFSPQIDYIETDLTGAYGDQLSTFKRTFVFLRPDTLIVSDDLRARLPHIFTWLLHPANDTMPSVSGNRVRIQTTSASTDVLATGAEWEMKPTPLPISLFQDLNRTIHNRYVLRLQSKRSQQARFTVALQFHPIGVNTQPANAQPKNTAVFRTGLEPLRLSDLVADARVLAARDAAWLSIGATKVSRNDTPLVSSPSEINVAYTQSPNQIQIIVATPATAPVTFHLPADASAAFIDDAPIKPAPVVVQSLSKGEHHVRILTGKSL